LPRSVKVSLLGYFGQEGYKLLDQKTGVVFKSRNIIFKEGITHLAEQTMYTSFSEDNNPFQYYSIQNIEIKDSESHRSEYQTQKNQTRGDVMNIEWDYNYYQPWSNNEWLEMRCWQC